MATNIVTSYSVGPDGPTGPTGPEGDSYVEVFTDADMFSPGVLTINHNLGTQYLVVQVYNELDQQVTPDSIDLIDDDNVQIDLSSFGTLSGTWHAVVTMGGWQGPTGPTGPTGPQFNPLTADLDADGYDIYDAATITFEAEYSNGDSGASPTVNWNNGQKQSIVCSAATVTFTFTAPTNGVGNFLLRLIQDNPAATTTINWPGSVLWAGGTEPTWSTSDDEIDIVSFYYDGTNYYGVGNVGFA